MKISEIIKRAWFSMCFLLFLCASSCGMAEEYNKAQQKRTKSNIEATGHSNIEEIHLKDGTRCVMLVSGRRAGLSCDWK